MAKDYPMPLHDKPVDRVAARVIAGGEHYEHRKANNKREIWDGPRSILTDIPNSFKKLLHTRKGRLVVIGFTRLCYNAQRGQCRLRTQHICKCKLLVRCDCGHYESRKAAKWSALRDVLNFCQFCEQKEYLKTTYLSDSEKERLATAERIRQGVVNRKLNLGKVG